MMGPQGRHEPTTLISWRQRRPRPSHNSRKHRRKRRRLKGGSRRSLRCSPAPRQRPLGPGPSPGLRGPSRPRFDLRWPTRSNCSDAPPGCSTTASSNRPSACSSLTVSVSLTGCSPTNASGSLSSSSDCVTDVHRHPRTPEAACPCTHDAKRRVIKSRCEPSGPLTPRRDAIGVRTRVPRARRAQKKLSMLTPCESVGGLAAPHGSEPVKTVPDFDIERLLEDSAVSSDPDRIEAVRQRLFQTASTAGLSTGESLEDRTWRRMSGHRRATRP